MGWQGQLSALQATQVPRSLPSPALLLPLLCWSAQRGLQQQQPHYSWLGGMEEMNVGEWWSVAWRRVWPHSAAAVTAPATAPAPAPALLAAAAASAAAWPPAGAQSALPGHSLSSSPPCSPSQPVPALLSPPSPPACLQHRHWMPHRSLSSTPCRASPHPASSPHCLGTTWHGPWLGPCPAR